MHPAWSARKLVNNVGVTCVMVVPPKEVGRDMRHFREKKKSTGLCAWLVMKNKGKNKPHDTGSPNGREQLE